MDHSFSPMLEPRESDFNVHYDARIEIQTRGKFGWLQLVNAINVNFNESVTNCVETGSKERKG